MDGSPTAAERMKPWQQLPDDAVSKVLAHIIANEIGSLCFPQTADELIDMLTDRLFGEGA